MSTAAPKLARFAVDFHEWVSAGLIPSRGITAVVEYRSQEDKTRNRPVQPWVDEATGRRLFRWTFADPSADKDREKSVTVELACAHQPAPPAAVAGCRFGQ